MRVIDSSAIVKFFAEEPGWEDLKEFMYFSMTIELGIIELSNALIKKVRRNEFQESKVNIILSRYASILRFLDQKKYISGAFDIAIKHKMSIYDSLFICAALNEGYELVTCDRKQAMVAKEIGVKVIEF